MPPHGIMFHHFYDSVHPKGQGAASADDLERLIHHYGRDRILSADTWMKKVKEQSLNDRDICFTFDDGLRCQYDVALPILKKYDLTAFWFIYSAVYQEEKVSLEIYRFFRTSKFDNIDIFYEQFFQRSQDLYYSDCNSALPHFDAVKFLSEYSCYSLNDRKFRYLRDEVFSSQQYNDVMASLLKDAKFSPKSIEHLLWMDDDQLLELYNAGHNIGLHSFSHPMRMTNLSAANQSDEYERNYNHILSVTGTPPYSMSHPANSYNQETLKILDNMGIHIGFRANMEPVENRTLYEIPRENHTDILNRISEKFSN